MTWKQIKEIESHTNFQDIEFDSFEYLKKEGLLII